MTVVSKDAASRAATLGAAVACLALGVGCRGSELGVGSPASADLPETGAVVGSSGDGSSSSDGDAGGGGGSGDAQSGGGEQEDAGNGAQGDAEDAGAEDLDPSVAPGGNFDLSLWELQEPVGSPGDPTTISTDKLEGASGYQDTYFFTDPTDGSMSFWDPENGVTTENSDYPRSELREMTAAGEGANWLPTGTNTLSATVKATLIPSKVVVGQIHLGTGTPASTKPLLELYYYSTGKITIGIEQTPAGDNEVETTAVGTSRSGRSGATSSVSRGARSA